MYYYFLNMPFVNKRQHASNRIREPTHTVQGKDRKKTVSSAHYRMFYEQNINWA